jgi:hypothetical protein
MATLQTIVDTHIPDIQKARYSNQWVGWTNLLLKELASRAIMPMLKKEIGVLVSNKRWIEKPSDYRSLDSIMFAKNSSMQLRVEEVNNRFRLLDFDINEDSAPVPAGNLTGITSTVKGCSPLLVGRAENDLAEYLFVQYDADGVVLSTSVIVGNDASGATTTAIKYLHPKTAALSFGATDTGALIASDYYVLMSYWSAYAAITAMSDEVPINNEMEEAVVVPWLRWKVEERLSEISNETKYWYQQALSAIIRASTEVDRAPKNQARGRRLVGFESQRSRVKAHPKYSTFSS